MQIIFDPSNSNDNFIVQEIITLLSKQSTMPASTLTSVPIQTTLPKGPCDIGGTPWNVRLHTDSKNKTNKGFWKRRKGASLEEYDAFAKLFSMTAPPLPAAPLPAAPLPAPHLLIIEDEDMLTKIDNLFADIQDKDVVDDFRTWSGQMLNWCKPGATTVSDLTGDMSAQEQLFNHLSSL